GSREPWLLRVVEVANGPLVAPYESRKRAASQRVPGSPAPPPPAPPASRPRRSAPIRPQDAIGLALRVLHRLLGRLGAGERGLQPVVQRLGHALVVVGGELGHRVLQLVARHRGGREAGDVLLHGRRLPRGGDVIHLMNFSEAACWAGVLFLKMWKFPPPVGEPRRFPAGNIATPKSNLALFFTLVRLPVVVHIMAVLRSKKSLGVVPHSMIPVGITL